MFMDLVAIISSVGTPVSWASKEYTVGAASPSSTSFDNPDGEEVEDDSVDVDCEGE